MHWSDRILDEVARNQIEKVPGFTPARAQLLCDLMNKAITDASVEPTAENYASIEGYELPDENDRHVIATAIAADADVVCTANIKDFPTDVMADIGIECLGFDEVLARMIASSPDIIKQVHGHISTQKSHWSPPQTVGELSKRGYARSASAMHKLIQGSTYVRPHIRCGHPVRGHWRQLL